MATLTSKKNAISPPVKNSILIINITKIVVSKLALIKPFIISKETSKQIVNAEAIKKLMVQLASLSQTGWGGMSRGKGRGMGWGRGDEMGWGEDRGGRWGESHL